MNARQEQAPRESTERNEGSGKGEETGGGVAVDIERRTVHGTVEDCLRMGQGAHRENGFPVDRGN